MRRRLKAWILSLLRPKPVPMEEEPERIFRRGQFALPFRARHWWPEPGDPPLPPQHPMAKKTVAGVALVLLLGCGSSSPCGGTLTAPGPVFGAETLHPDQSAELPSLLCGTAANPSPRSTP